METINLYGGIGFLASAITAFGIAALLFTLIFAPFSSFYPFSFVVVSFIIAILGRGLAWRRVYNRVREVRYLLSFFAVLLLGIVVFVLMLYLASMQLNVLPLGNYIDDPLLVLVLLIWTMYSLSESISTAQTFNGTAFSFTKYSIVTVLLIDASFIYLINYSSIIVPLLFTALGAFACAESVAFFGKKFPGLSKNQTGGIWSR